MKPSSSPTYPSSQELSYAVRLKHFATRLPAYASRYQLSLSEVIEVQCLAIEFVTALTQRIYCTTASLQQPQHAPTALAGRSTDGQPTIPVIYRVINEVVSYIQLHPEYSTADGDALGLAALNEMQDAQPQILNRESDVRILSPVS